VTLIGACATRGGEASFRWSNGTFGEEAGDAFAIRWTRDLTHGGPYVPVELASPVAAPAIGRVYAGSTQGSVWSIDANGRRMFEYVAAGAVEAPVTVDVAKRELFVTSVRGEVAALDAQTGELRWKTTLEESITQSGLLSEDALYLVTDHDAVVALSRADGSTLWRYRRTEMPEGFAIVGHAGLALAGRKVIAGFGDGGVAALDASDGRMVWELDTSLDLESMDPTRRYLDVDTTPVVVDDVAYVASFSGGLYGIDVASGTVRHQEAQYRGVTGLATDGQALVLSSAEQGVVCLELGTLAPRWRHDSHRNGAPGQPRVARNRVFVPESQGGMVALAMEDGREVGRLLTAHGITSAASLEDGQGFVLSNAGRLFAFAY
jgi:outer membrane protein assembly factor BamB